MVYLCGWNVALFLIIYFIKWQDLLTANHGNEHVGQWNKVVLARRLFELELVNASEHQVAFEVGVLLFAGVFLAESKVYQNGLSIGIHHHVFGLQITVDTPDTVETLQSCKQLACHGEWTAVLGVRFVFWHDHVTAGASALIFVKIIKYHDFVVNYIWYVAGFPGF